MTEVTVEIYAGIPQERDVNTSDLVKGLFEGLGIADATFTRHLRPSNHHCYATVYRIDEDMALDFANAINRHEGLAAKIIRSSENR